MQRRILLHCLFPTSLNHESGKAPQSSLVKAKLVEWTMVKVATISHGLREFA